MLLATNLSRVVYACPLGRGGAGRVYAVQDVRGAPARSYIVHLRVPIQPVPSHLTIWRCKRAGKIIVGTKERLFLCEIEKFFFDK